MLLNVYFSITRMYLLWPGYPDLFDHPGLPLVVPQSCCHQHQAQGPDWSLGVQVTYGVGTMLISHPCPQAFCEKAENMYEIESLQVLGNHLPHIVAPEQHALYSNVLFE